MSTPGPPLTNFQPRSTNQSLEYAWQPPIDDGGSAIQGYRIQLNSDPYIEVPAEFRYIQVSGLTNGTTYNTTIEASNANGYGTVAYFRPFQPGSILPGPPSTATATVIDANSALVSWTPPLNAPSLDAPIQWYAIYSQSSSPSDPVISITANALTQSNYYISGLTASSQYSFNVYSVNCPGWSSLYTTTNTITPLPVGDFIFQATFDTTTNTDGFSNYDSNRLIVNSPTGVGYSYLTTWNYTGSNSLYKTYTSTTTNTVSYTCSVYRTAAATQFTGIMMNRTPTGNGLSMFDSTNLNYIWANATSATSGIVLPLNEWVHLALTMTSSNARIYVNGELATTYTASHTAQTMSDVYIGTDSAAASTRTFPGYIDNIRFYTRTLSASEVFQIYSYFQAIQTNTPLPTTITGLQAWYDGADPLGTGTPPSSGSVVSTWSDKSGNARNATGVASPTYILGNQGYISLNGSSQYYTLSTGSFIAGQYFTIFIVERLQASTSAPILVGGSTLSLNSNLVIYYNLTNSTTLYLDYYGNFVAATTVPAFNIAGSQPIRIWTFRQIASQRSIWINGIPFAQDTNNTLLLNWLGAAIGYYNANYYNGRMMDLLFYTGIMTIDNMQQILGYLANKWRVSIPQFIPPKVSGLVLWLDANDASSFTLSGSNVTQWRDKSGSGNHFSVVSGTPTRITDGSLTVVNISGGTIMTGTSSISFTTSYSIFVVTKVTAPNNVGSGGIQNFMDVSTKSIRYVGASGSLSTLQLNGGPNSTPNADDLVSIFQVNGSRNATASSVYTAYHMFDGPPQASVSGIPRLSTSFESRYFNGNVCEILIFNTAMINLNREKVQGYLAWKWGINSLLPSTHTYYSVAPSC
jgi:hypothetical protein